MSTRAPHSFTTWKLIASVAVALTIGTVCLAQETAKKDDPAVAGVAAVMRSYMAAFNKNDAPALAALWAAEGVYTDGHSGERTTGRAALLADFQKTFKDYPGARLTAEVTEARLIKPDVALIGGRSTLILPNEQPDTSAFTAVLVKQGETWLLDSVQETPLPSPESAEQALKQLEFLVGHWTDQSSDVNVDTIVRWGAGNTFLVRSFVSRIQEEEVQQGTQVIGWDPREKQIRSWSFFTDGSFAEGTWSKSGNQWLVKTTHTLDDGRIASGTQVIDRVDDNTLTVTIVARDIDGEPAATIAPVKVIRVPAAAAAPAPSSAPKLAPSR